MVLLAPSILSADFLRLGQQVDALLAADYLHLDVMDGHFVPNISFGADLVRQLGRRYSLPLDVHLMISEPERHLDAFTSAGASVISVHVEACRHLHRTLAAIRERGVEASVALNPATPLETLRWVISEVDQVLIMTVNPGFGGQPFLEPMVEKVEQLAAWREREGLAFRIQVDGGVNARSLPALVRAGADVLVIGSALFTGEHGDPGASLAFFRELAQETAAAAAQREK